ncbi:cation transporter [Helicobacter muridarum]|uniref:Cation diffusion facilitator family transporter n=1 Tax=Helicobacter muridarum TaxID=216 RepID=A0A099TY93_9HELI|nr:cation transporter [Helicobacter muridarum]TLE00931.1 cation transporter [Helicobacter muridarum]STQ86710.1 cation diffusion facilitator family transporter [Helicobacter muridarum]
MQFNNIKNNYGKKIRDKKSQDIDSSLQNKNHKQEQFALKISMYCACLLAFLGIGFGLVLKSSTLVFDGIVCFVSVALGFLSVVTSRYIYKEDDDIFQYGYVRFEPMVNLFKSLVLVVVCIYAFTSGLRDIIHGGYTLEIGGAVIYTLCAFIISFALYRYTSFYAKMLDSDLVAVDSTEWWIDCIMYLGGIIAFGIIFIFDSKQEYAISHYIDPSLLMILSIFLAITPIKIMIVNFKDLVMVAPKTLDNKITEIMEKISNEYGFQDYDTHVAKSGRFFMIEVNILNTNKNDKISIGEIDVIRDKIEKYLDIPSYKIWLSVNITANPKWL